MAALPPRAEKSGDVFPDVDDPRYRRLARRWLRGSLRRVDDSVDLVQSAAARYLQCTNEEVQADPTARSRYFWKVLRGKLADRYRASRGGGRRSFEAERMLPGDRLDEVAAPAQTPSERLCEEERRDEVIERADAIADAASRQQRAIIRQTMAGRSPKAIALSLGLHPGYVRRVVASFKRRIVGELS